MNRIALPELDLHHPQNELLFTLETWLDAQEMLDPVPDDRKEGRDQYFEYSQDTDQERKERQILFSRV
jgi:hypothetical protein